MRIHTQSAIAYTGKLDGEYTEQTDRRYHSAVHVQCPTCGARAGGRCVQDGQLMHPLSVHMARQEASL